MATSQTIEVLQHLRRAVLLRDGAGLTDGQLLADYLSRRDGAALTALVRRHGPMVWGVCRRVLGNFHDAEDAFQATFLVLVRKAASIASKELLANWLYGVAHQTAWKARATIAKRKGRERQVTAMPEPAVVEPELRNDLQPVLDQELSRLPTHYRAVLVLCDLEGKTRKETARQLGLPEGTIGSRLARARALLAKRLTRHGLAVSGGTLAAVLSHNVAAASVPPAVVTSTIRAATAWAAGQAAAPGLISVKVAALAEGVSNTMVATQTAKWWCLAAGLLIALTAGLVAYRSRATPEFEEIWGAAQPVETLPAEATVTLAGRVVGVDGAPAAGVKVVALTQYPSNVGDAGRHATTAGDGTFELPVPRAELAVLLGAGRGVYLVAAAEGSGLAWRSAAAFLPEGERDRSQPAVLQLAQDEPVVGQITTPGGLPAKGVRLELDALWASDRGDLGPWLTAVGKGEGFGQATWGRLRHYLTGTGLARFAASTDAEGRFRLAGLGRNRLAALRVFGPNAACTTVLARTVRGAKVEVNGLASAFFTKAHGCYGAEFTIKVEPSRAVAGLVKDAETGKPIAGAVVQSHRFAGSSMIPVAALTTRADTAGRFRMEGLPVGPDNLVLVRSPGDQSYLPAVAEVATAAGEGPVELQVELRRGVWVEGRVTDAKTGRPLFAMIDVFSPRKNPTLSKFPNFRMIPPDLCRTDAAGRFRIPAVPGKVAVAVKLIGKESASFGKRSIAQAGRTYRLLDSTAKIDGLPDDDEPSQTSYYQVQPWVLETAKYSQIRVIEVPAGTSSVACDFKAE